MGKNLRHLGYEEEINIRLVAWRRSHLLKCKQMTEDDDGDLYHFLKLSFLSYRKMPALKRALKEIALKGSGVLVFAYQQDAS
ncbi:hypothetical protein [Bartonella sp. MM73XJBT]|uniref:hypothetical protein n=2 Tax=unclassified Bartonella TaxID=2645622 RepID=UPI002362EDD0|nr:hypothetical protein [Bartonella sp. MM73XJBT]